MSRRRTAERWSRPRLATVVAGALVGSLLPMLPLAATALAADAELPRSTSPEKSVKGSDAKVLPRTTDTTISSPDGGQANWPAPAQAVVTVPTDKDSSARAGSLPVSLSSTENLPTAREATVQVMSRELTKAAGISGLLMSVSSPQAGAGERSDVSVDYADFNRAVGAGFGARLRLVQLPACVLTTPQLEECRTQTPLESSNDVDAQRVTATGVSLGTAAPAGSTRLSSTGGGVVLAATTGSGGPTGDYKATPLSSASTWSTALNTGSFQWNYDLPITPMPGGLTPDLGLSYSSGAIDGRTANSNNQASWAGDGFELSPGFVERTYRPCSDEDVKTNGNPVGDLCWATDNATMSFAGHSGELIPVSADEWRLKGDDATKVVRIRDTNRGNGDNDGEYFVATTSDGVRFHFGYNRLPNWSAGKPETKSVYTVPVFGNNAGEPCNAGTFATSWCQQGWRWNLDLVTDANGNDITYWYAPETNNYGRNLKASDRTPYVRGGRLEHVEYGQQQGDILSASVKPMGRVDFAVAERCLESNAALCDPATIDANRQYWYDTPWDQACKDGTDCDNGRFSPTFFTRTRLTGVTASTLRADGSYQPVDTWAFTHKWGTADVDYQLLLDTITHTGKSAPSSIELPKTRLSYQPMANRLDRVGDGRAPFYKQRLGTVTDETGGQIDVNYSAAACDWNNLPTPQSNTTRCFPQQYQGSPTAPVVTEWFNKYVVNTVIGTDRTGGAPDAFTRYTYLGDAAWHFDDEDGITKEKLKTWSQWRGYSRVRVQTGGASGMSTQQDHYFLRGMHDDRSDPSDKSKKRAVTVDNGQGTWLTDDQAWAGYEYRTEQYSGPDGSVLGKTVSIPWKKETARRVRDWGTTTANLVDTAETRSYTSLDNGAGANWREVRTVNGFDDFGRATTVEKLGDIAVAGDDTCTRNTFADNTSAWILDGVIRTESVAGSCSAQVNRDTQADGSSAVLSDVRYRYDGQGYGAAPVKGNVTLTHTLKSRTGNSGQYLDSATTHDAYGRVLTSTELPSTTTFDMNGVGTPTATSPSNGRTTSTVFTPATGRPTSSTITSPPATSGNAATAQTTTTEFDLGRGLSTGQVDANNRRTDRVYDALGRLTQVWLPNRIKGTNGANQEYDYTVAEGRIVAVTSRSLNGGGGGFDTRYTLYDGFGRVRQTQGPGSGGGRILTDNFYDERGQVARSYAPYHAEGAPSSTLFAVEQADRVETQTTTGYDGLGRVTRQSLLSGNGVGTPLSTTLTEYNGDRTTVTPPKGATPTTTLVDALGRTTELRQYKAATPTGDFDTTRYTYDAADRMTGLTGPDGTAWGWTYDQSGRQVKQVDPDTGTTTKAYNDRGELVSSTDGRGRTIAQVYDNLSRPLETREGSTTGPLLTSRTWDPANNKGLPSTSVRHAAIGGTTYQYKTTYSLYDPLGRPTRTTYTIPSVPGQEALAGSYPTGVIYQLDGLPQSVSYPTAGNLPQEAVAFTYDELQQLKTVGSTTTSSYLTDQTFSLTGKLLDSYLSNGTAGKTLQVTSGYEWGTQRLKTSQTRQQNASTPLRHAFYDYDEAGNVTGVTDTSAAGTDRQCFRYDYLARLTEAYTPSAANCTAAPDGSALGGPAPYWNSFTYNTNSTRATETRHNPGGNTGLDTRTTYDYVPGRSHALAGTTSITGSTGAPVVQSYSYDASGNTTGRRTKPAADKDSDQVLTWNAEGQVEKVVDTVKTTVGSTVSTTARTTDYLYGPDGNRLVTHDLDSADPAAENWTVNLGATELKLTKGAAKPAATRYYPLGAVTGVRTDDNRLTFQVNDHHGTAELNIDATTGAVTQRRTTPFGETRGTQPTTWAGTRGFLGGINEKTGLVRLGARDYDPTTGQFTSVDPLLDASSPTTLTGYTYSGANPVTYSDPTGLNREAPEAIDSGRMLSFGPSGRFTVTKAGGSSFGSLRSNFSRAGSSRGIIFAPARTVRVPNLRSPSSSNPLRSARQQRELDDSIRSGVADGLRELVFDALAGGSAEGPTPGEYKRNSPLPGGSKSNANKKDMVVYRGMTAAADGLPVVGRSGKTLGVRVEGKNADVRVSNQGTVPPIKGMSTGINPYELLPHRLPTQFGGEGKNMDLFSIRTGDLPEGLEAIKDGSNHVSIRPAREMPLGQYEELLASTRNLWTRIEP